MKRIAICCDGTWRRLDEQLSTNVVCTACSVLRQAFDGRPQIVVHLDGVGTGRGTGRLARTIDRFAGGALGHGLIEAVAEAYRVLVFNYEPGDEIYLFGYSRGAYTARSLGGLIRNAGIVSRDRARQIGAAVTLYRSRAKADEPTGENAFAFRADNAYETFIGDDDLEWRKANRPKTDWSGTRPLKIRYVGVWDTVGALGVPGFLTVAPLLNGRHRFHDPELSSHVEAARHAVAIDEKRRTFPPALWTNLSKLNAGSSGDGAPYQQRWFPGVHGAVGGGGDDDRLSSYALDWILEGAERQGLAIESQAREGFRRARDHRGSLDGTRTPPSFGDRLRRWPTRDREGPPADELDCLGVSARERWLSDGTYRPRALGRVRALLDRPDTQREVA